TVQQLVDRLGKDFKYSFFILDDQVSKTRVTVNKSNATINEILEEAFRSKEITYLIQTKNIIISKKKETQTSGFNEPVETIPIKGVVVDVNKQPVIGAIIEVRNTNLKAIADGVGKFSIKAPSNGELIVSFMGYGMQVIPLSGKSTYEIVLQEDVHTLDDVVVVGYGTQKKGNRTGSVSSIKTENLTIAPITNVTTSL